MFSKKDIIKAEDLISGAFIWADTIEGHEYWMAVSNKLLHMAEAQGKLEKMENENG